MQIQGGKWKRWKKRGGKLHKNEKKALKMHFLGYKLRKFRPAIWPVAGERKLKVADGEKNDRNVQYIPLQNWLDY